MGPAGARLGAGRGPARPGPVSAAWVYFARVEPLPNFGGSLGLFDEFERRLERVVDGFFSKAFRSPIQPAEIGRRLLREMEGGKTVSVGAVYVPNSYVIHLDPEDFERFEGLIPTLREEFAGLLQHSAADRRWHFPGALVVTFDEDGSVAPGRFEVHAEHDAAAVAPPVPAEPVLKDRLPPGVRTCWRDLASFNLVVHNCSRSIHPVTWRVSHDVVRFIRALTSVSPNCAAPLDRVTRQCEPVRAAR